MSAFGPPVSGLRTIRIVIVLIACGVVLNTCGVVVSFFLNSDRVDQINQERSQNVERNCQDVNSRNTAAVLELDRLLAARGSNTTAKQFERSRENTKALIDALVPRRDCARLASQQVDSK